MHIYNSFTNKLEKFEPVVKGKVGIYTCGPTVYGYSHVGNFSAFIMADLLVRYLKYKGNEVKWIMNITDVGHMTDDSIGSGDSGEDKLQKASQKENKTVWELARYYEAAFKKDLDLLNIKSVNLFPRATEHITDMIKMIEGLEAKGFVYETSDGLYFDISKFPNYGKLSGNTLENLNAGARIEINEDKKSPYDFALWKKIIGKNSNHAMRWDSPWGAGFPGWHLECSAMSRKYLGDTLDFHTGGEDNKFPHHESEIAQSESFTGKQFVKYWLHKSRVMINSEKMSKSLGNYFTLKDLIDKNYDPLTVRYTFISVHYRSKLNFTEEGLEQSARNLARINDFIQSMHLVEQESGDQKVVAAIIKSARMQFEKALDEDLNVSKAFAAIFGLMKAIRKQNNKGNLNKSSALAVLAFMKDVNSVFAVFKLEKEEKKDVSKEYSEEILELLEQRRAYRKAKEFEKADAIREELIKMGVDVADQKL